MASNKKKVSASFYSQNGQTALTMLKFRREGDNLIMVGKLMGAWESDIVVKRDEMIEAIKIVMTPTVIGYVLSLPFMKRSTAR